MSDWRSPLMAAINARALADTGSGGLFAASNPLIPTAGAIYQGAAPTRAAMPFLVFRLVNIAVADTFRDVEHVVEWAMDIYVGETDTAYDPTDRANKITERVIGDWVEQADRTPTYGFDGWSPDLSASGWTGLASNIRTAERDLPEPGVVHRVIEFELRVFRAGV